VRYKKQASGPQTNRVPGVPRRELQVVVVSEHAVIRESLTALLPRHGIRVIGSAGAFAAARDMIDRRRPNVVVTELYVSGRSAAELVVTAPGTRAFVFTDSDSPFELQAALDRGASGIALKGTGSEDLAHGIRRVAKGDRWLDEPTKRLLTDLRPKRTLTSRQAEMLELLARGFTAEEIAARRGLSSATVQKHVQNAIGTLHARGRLHAVVIAACRGDISIGVAPESAPTGAARWTPRAREYL
jgi:DNA-binding NarL/FixJ family response regulator